MRWSLACAPGSPAAAVAIGGAPAVGGLLVAGVVLGLLAFWPLGTVLVAAAGAPRAGAEVARATLGSLTLAVASTAATVALAAPLAYAVARAEVPGRRPLAVAARLPLLAPSFVPGLALLLVLGPRAQTAGALVLAQVLAFVPHAYVLLAARLGELARDREDAAESLGASRWVVFHRVTLPLAWPALRSAMLVVFLLSLGDLGNPLLVGGDHPVLAREVYTRAVGGGDPAGASLLALVLVAPSLAAWGLGRGRVLAAAGAPAVRGRAVPPWRPVVPAVGWPLTAVAGVVAAAVIAGGLVVVVGSLVGGGGGRPSLAHWTVLAGLDARAVGVSLALALLAGMLGTLLSLALAYVLERPRLPLAVVVRTLASLPAPVPGVVLGLGYLLALGGPPATVTPGLAVLAASVVVSRLSVGLGIAGDTLRRIDPATESTALALGAGPGRTLARVVLPQLAPTGVAAFALFFVNGLVSVAPVAFLASAALEPAAVAALTRAAGGAAGEACALVTLLLALVAVAAVVVRALAGRTPAAVLFL